MLQKKEKKRRREKSCTKVKPKTANKEYLFHTCIVPQWLCMAQTRFVSTFISKWHVTNISNLNKQFQLQVLYIYLNISLSYLFKEIAQGKSNAELISSAHPLIRMAAEAQRNPIVNMPKLPRDYHGFSESAPKCTHMIYVSNKRTHLPLSSANVLIYQVSPGF